MGELICPFGNIRIRWIFCRGQATGKSACGPRLRCRLSGRKKGKKMNKQKESTPKTDVCKGYAEMVSRVTPKSKLLQGCLRAFWVGGVICMIGQGFTDLSAAFLQLNSGAAALFGSVSLVFFTALLTGIGVFDRIGKYAGAGAIVPISGFANAMVSPALGL